LGIDASEFKPQGSSVSSNNKNEIGGAGSGVRSEGGAEVLETNVGAGAGATPAMSTIEHSAGPSFARIAKLGFAATGPALGGEGDSALGGSPQGHSPSTGVWGSSLPTAADTLSIAWTSGRLDRPSPTPRLVNESVNEACPGSKRKKSGKKMLLLSTAQRRY